MKLVAGNWKMNLSKDQATSLCKRLKEEQVEGVSFAVYPSSIHIPLAIQHLRDTYYIGAQNCATEEYGAFTGEISAAMIKSYGCDSILIGHSERRKLFEETNAKLMQKVDTALAAEIHVLFCIGETLEEREAGRTEEVLSQQLNQSLFHLSSEEFLKISIAYEPVWAIGTGKAATPETAQETHHYIRETIRKHYSDEVAEGTSILYGGSVKPDNAKELFSQEDIDGGLIGGASLKADDFIEIARSF